MTLADIGLGFLQSWVNFGVVSIASAQCAILVTYLRLPLITGYMLFGVLAGPQLCNLVTSTDLPNLAYITQFALAFIALSAGAELYLPELKALFKRILVLTGLLTVITFILVLVVVYGESMGGLVSYTSDLPSTVSASGCQFSIALIAAAIMVSQSPASAIAVVRELKAKGPFTSTMLGVCVLIDVVVLVLASISTSIANSECDPNSDGFQILDLFLTFITVVSAVLVGWILGKIIIFLIWLPRVPGEWLVPPLGFGVFQFSSWFLTTSTNLWGHGVNMDPLLICITGGYVVANQSRNRRKFLRFFNMAGPIIFIPFFTLTGAGLKLSVLLKSIPFAFITFFTRGVAFFASGVLGGRWTEMPLLQQRTLWLSMLTQAGVSLGIAAEVALAFPTWGPDFQTTIISVILINQVAGPVLCAWAIGKNNEVNKAQIDDDEEDKIKRCLIVGVNDDSFALAQRLLLANWDILFLDTDEQRLAMTKALIVPLRRKHSLAGGEQEHHDMQTGETISTQQASIHPSEFSESRPPADEQTEEASRIELTSRVSSSVQYDADDVHNEVEEEEKKDVVAPVTVDDDADNDDHHRPDARVPSPVSVSVPVNGSDPYLPVPTTERVTTRLVTPVKLPTSTTQSDESSLTLSGSAWGRRKTAEKKHASLTEGFKAQLSDVTPSNTQCVVIFLPLDSQSFALSNLLLEQFHLTKVVVQVNNPNWASMFANIGVLSIYSFSCTVSMLFQCVISQPGRFQLINNKKPLHTELADMIKPDTTSTVPIHLSYCTDNDQNEFLATHPNPPLPAEQLWKFNEKFTVVPQAAREEYVNSIYGIYAGQTFIDPARNLQRAGATFSGPMQSGHYGDEEEEERQREHREQDALDEEEEEEEEEEDQQGELEMEQHNREESQEDSKQMP